MLRGEGFEQPAARFILRRVHRLAVLSLSISSPPPPAHGRRVPPGALGLLFGSAVRRWLTAGRDFDLGLSLYNHDMRQVFRHGLRTDYFRAWLCALSRTLVFDMHCKTCARLLSTAPAKLDEAAHRSVSRDLGLHGRSPCHRARVQALSESRRATLMSARTWRRIASLRQDARLSW